MLDRLVFLFCGLALLSATAAFAQRGGVGVGLSPVPIWPSDGVVPASLGDWYVFLDIQSNQLVLTWPEDLGSPSFERKPGARRIERIDLNNRVEPSVSIAVRRSESGFEYRYRVTNGETAEQPIRRLEMPVSAFRIGTDTIVAPASWTNTAEPIPNTGVQGLAVPNVSMQYLLTEDIPKEILSELLRNLPVLLRWDADSRPRGGQAQFSAIPPGGQRDAFEVRSPLRPGFTTVYAFGGAPPELDGDIPSVVREQARPILISRGQPAVTIGPMIRAEASTREIVGDFQLGISRLAEEGRLDAGSPAIHEALRALDGYMDYLRAAYTGMEDVPLADLQGSPLAFRETPGNDLEAEVLQAMQLSLGF